MAQLVACPDCNKHLQVPDNLLGKKVQCPECKGTFTAQAPDEDEPRTATTAKPTPSKNVPAKVPAWDKRSSSDDEDDDEDRDSRPKKRRRDDDDGDDDRRGRRRRRASSRRD